MSITHTYSKRTNAYREVADLELCLCQEDYPTGGSSGFRDLFDNTKKVIKKILGDNMVIQRGWKLEFDEHHYSDDGQWDVTFTYRLESLNWGVGGDRPPIWLEGETTVTAETPTQLCDKLVAKLADIQAYEEKVREGLVLVDHMAKVKTTETV